MHDLTVGQLVVSTAGRDKNRNFIVLCIIDEQYVYISDGDIRKVSNPKKKKKKHLKNLMTVSQSIGSRIELNQKITDCEIREFLKSVEGYREREV